MAHTNPTANEEYEGNRNTKFEPHSGGAIPIQINGHNYFCEGLIDFQIPLVFFIRLCLRESALTGVLTVRLVDLPEPDEAMQQQEDVDEQMAL